MFLVSFRNSTLELEQTDENCSSKADKTASQMLVIVGEKIENKRECNSALLLKPHILTVCKGEDGSPISEKL